MTGASLEVMSSARPPGCARTHVAGVPPGVSCYAFLSSSSSSAQDPAVVAGLYCFLVIESTHFIVRLLQMLTDSHVQQYLEHIDRAHLISPTLSSLIAIHEAHICKFPFNNLSTVQNNRNVRSMGFHPSPPSLEIDCIFNKLVQQHRGGYCFEHNGLLAAVLQHLGYELYATFANVVRENPEATAKGQVELKGFNHEVLHVRVPEDCHWRLVDAGFGGIPPTQPVILQHPADDSYTGETMFRVRRGLNGRLAVPTQEDLEKNSHAVGWYMQRYSDTIKQWQDQSSFTETVATQGDFEVLNWAVATDPRKGFYHTLMMGIQRPDGGRVTVLDDALKIYKSNGDVEERTLQTPEEFQAAMQEHFGIAPITS